tara:strand:- start:50941 stop:52041 length:1101 start_codon:yes stop_codon:yes gene_type:complete
MTNRFKKIFLSSCLIVGLISMALPAHANIATEIGAQVVGTLQHMSEQISSAVQSGTQQDSTLTDDAVAKDTINESNEDVVDTTLENQYSERICSDISVLSLGSNERRERTEEAESGFFDGLTSMVYERTGSLGGLSDSERGQALSSVKATFCSTNEQGGNLEGFCDEQTASGQRRINPVSPQNVAGITNLDVTGDNADIITYMSNFVEPVNFPAPGTGGSRLVGPVGRTVAHKAVVQSSLATLLSLNTSSETVNMDAVEGLFDAMGASDEFRAQYLPEDGRLSEDGMLEIIVNFYVSNPEFFTDMAMSETNIEQLRPILMAQHLRLDQKILQLRNQRLRHKAMITSLDANERAEGPISELVDTVNQ